MPIVIKQPHESEEKFIARCMGNAQMVREFPDEEQRAAVCYEIFRR